MKISAQGLVSETEGNLTEFVKMLFGNFCFENIT